MITHTKTLFSSILKAVEADGVCDIGSRDGDQALLFRHLLPQAAVIAFEANPINFGTMSSKKSLQEGRIDIFPLAVSGENGRATFHVTDVDYSNPEENIGTSSLLVHDGLKVKESVEVEVCRIDDFILSRYPGLRRIGLWIDVEGVEYGVLQGMEKIRDRVVALHVETARVPFRRGQQTYEEVERLARGMGFRVCGSNMSRKSTWGDVVFVNEQVIAALGARFTRFRLRALCIQWLRADALAVFLKTRLPWLYTFLRRLYIKAGT